MELIKANYFPHFNDFVLITTCTYTILKDVQNIANVQTIPMHFAQLIQSHSSKRFYNNKETTNFELKKDVP